MKKSTTKRKPTINVVCAEADLTEIDRLVFDTGIAIESAKARLSVIINNTIDHVFDGDEGAGYELEALAEKTLKEIERAHELQQQAIRKLWDQKREGVAQ